MNLTTSIGITTNAIRRLNVVSAGSSTATYFLLDGPSANYIVDGATNFIVWRI